MNKFLKQRKGITLISLVVTIIILIILAGVSISLIMGQDGLIEKAKETKPIQDIATAKEQLEMLKVPTQLNTYDVNLDNYLEELDRVKVEYEVNDVEKISNTQAEVVVGGKYKFLITDTEKGDVIIEYQGEATELILSETSGTYIYPTSGTFEVVKNITGGELSVKSENENIAKASISGNVITVEPQEIAGTVKITVTAAANGEYAEQRAVHLATVVNGEIELKATAYTGNYDGIEHNAITNVEVIPEDAKIEYSIDGGEYSEEVPTVTGAKGYTVSIRASKEGYTTKTISKTVTIGKAEAQSGNLVLSKTEGIITYPTQEKITVSKNISGGELSITSSNEDVATASIDKLTGEITITPKAVSADGQKTTITVTSSATANYAEQTATYEATINRGIIGIEATAYTGTYDGTAHNVVTSVSTTPTGTTLRYKLDSGDWQTTIPQVTNAKEEYTIVIEASKAGYATKTKTITVTINKLSANSSYLTLSATSGTLTYPTAGSFTVTKNTSGGTLSVASSNTAVATAKIDSAGKVTVTPGTTAGTATITVTSAATTNYVAQSAKYTATVKNGTITLAATPYTGDYDGTAHNAVTITSKSPSDVTIKYSLNGGSYTTTMPKVTNVGTYTVSIQASKAGYTTKTISKTATIIQPSYTVTYCVDTSTSYKETVQKGSTCLSPTTFTPSKSGYTFVGWRANNTASSTVLTSKVMGDSAISLYAVFKKDIKVTYYNNSTTAASSTKQAYYNNGNVANPSFTLTQASKSGWTARGWSTGTAGNSSISYNNATAFTRSSNVTLYGMYQQTITISYYQVSNTTKQTATGTRYYNSGKNVYTNPKFTINPSGYGTEWTFRGWTTGTAANASVTYSSISNMEFDSNKTLYVLLQRPVVVSYNGNGATSGTVASETKYVYLNSYNGNTYSNPSFTLKANGFAKTNYNFSKWALGSASGTQYAAGASVTLTANTTFYAVWASANKYLYSGTSNEAGFVAYRCGLDEYAGTPDGTEVYAQLPTVTVGSSLKVSIHSPSGSLKCGSVISNPIDVTNYKTLKFTHSSVSSVAGNYNFVKFGIVTTKREGSLQNYSRNTINLLAYNSSTATTSGTVTVDVSNITGNVYFVIFVACNEKGQDCYTNISNMYLIP